MHIIEHNLQTIVLRISITRNIAKSQHQNLNHNLDHKIKKFLISKPFLSLANFSSLLISLFNKQGIEL
jgi:hypothetical protein